VRKIILLLALLFVGADIAQAQMLSRTKIGVFAKPANSWLRAENPAIDGEMDMAWSIGLVCDQPFGSRYFISTGVEYMKVISDMQVFESGFNDLTDMKFDLGYITVPIGFKGRTRELINYFSIFGGAGVTAAILVDGRYSKNAPIGEEIINARIKDVVSPYAGAWYLEAGIEYETVSSTVFFIAARYDRSFTKVLEASVLNLDTDDNKVTYGHMGFRCGLFF